MKENLKYLEDIRQIRSIMERSSRFISLSGMSGIMAGIYALIGAYIGYRMVYVSKPLFVYRQVFVNESQIIIKLAIVAGFVLILAVSTGLWLTSRRAKALGISMWGEGSKNLLINLLIPLVTGGAFVVLLTLRGYYGIVAPAFLLFYGLALVNASKYTLTDVRYLGFSELLLGLLCTIFPGYGLVFWAFGFGVMHIVYGTLMYFKYEK